MKVVNHLARPRHDRNNQTVRKTCYIEFFEVRDRKRAVSTLSRNLDIHFADQRVAVTFVILALDSEFGRRQLYFANPGTEVWYQDPKVAVHFPISVQRKTRKIAYRIDGSSINGK